MTRDDPSPDQRRLSRSRCTNDDDGARQTETVNFADEIEPGRYSIKFTPPLNPRDGAEFLRLLEAEYPQFAVLDVVPS